MNSICTRIHMHSTSMSTLLNNTQRLPPARWFETNESRWCAAMTSTSTKEDNWGGDDNTISQTLRFATFLQDTSKIGDASNQCLNMIGMAGGGHDWCSLQWRLLLLVAPEEMRTWKTCELWGRTQICKWENRNSSKLEKEGEWQPDQGSEVLQDRKSVV